MSRLLSGPSKHPRLVPSCVCANRASLHGARSRAQILSLLGYGPGVQLLTCRLPDHVPNRINLHVPVDLSPGRPSGKPSRAPLSPLNRRRVFPFFATSSDTSVKLVRQSFLATLPFALQRNIHIPLFVSVPAVTATAPCLPSPLPRATSSVQSEPNTTQ